MSEKTGARRWLLALLEDDGETDVQWTECPVERVEIAVRHALELGADLVYVFKVEPDRNAVRVLIQQRASIVRAYAQHIETLHRG